MCASIHSHTCIYIHIYIYIYIYVYARKYMRIDPYIFTLTSINIIVQMYVCVTVCL